MGRGIRLTAVSVATGLALLLFAGSASATYHLIKVREVSPGTNGDDDSYVEVQMYAPLQRYLSMGAKVAVCNSTCSIPPSVFTDFSDVGSANTQDTVVFGDSGVPAGSKDFTVDLNLDAVEAGGAVCYVSEPTYTDCVSWGNFTGASTLTADYDASADPGTPAPALTSGSALRRSIAAGCPTLLESGDDTNDSAADFAAAAPDPRPNSVAPSETPCGSTPPPSGAPSQPGVSGVAKKKKKCKKHKKSSGNSPAYAAKKKCRKRK